MPYNSSATARATPQQWRMLKCFVRITSTQQTENNNTKKVHHHHNWPLLVDGPFSDRVFMDVCIFRECVCLSFGYVHTISHHHQASAERSTTLIALPRCTSSSSWPNSCAGSESASAHRCNAACWADAFIARCLYAINVCKRSARCAFHMFA